MILIHVDIDNLWIYEQEYGVAIGKDKELIYRQSLPVFLKLLKKSHSKATFMVVGKDLQLSACQQFCQRAIGEGHEIANHTWSHSISFNLLSTKQKQQEILRTHQLIAQVCGRNPVGFRGPGYYFDETVVSVLQDLHYQYDTSVLPGIAPLLMSLYAGLRGGANRHKMFGRIMYLFQPAKIYSISPSLWELPISILPIFRLPIHTTFMYSLGKYYQQLVLNYLKNKPSYLLYLFHAIDLVDLPNNKQHPVIPLRYTFEERIKLVQKILETLVKANGRPIKNTRERLKDL